jgi:hypothetical protein
MLRRSRALWGRSEDRCDGAGSEADGAKPPVKPGQKMPVLGVLVFRNRSALVKPPSSGFRINKARRSPGRFCPAFLFGFYSSSLSEVRVRSIWLAFHRGGPGRCSNPFMEARMAAEGFGGWRVRSCDGWGATAGLGRRAQAVMTR